MWAKQPRGKSLQIKFFCGQQCNSFVYNSTTKRLLSLYAVWKCNHVWLPLVITSFSEIHMNGARSVPTLLCSQFESHQTRILPLLVIPHHQILNNPLDFALPRSSHFIFVTAFQSLFSISFFFISL